MPASRTYAILGVIALMIVWGSTFVVTKAAAREISPLVLAALKFCLASIVLLPIAAARGGLRQLPRPVPWLTLASMALTGIALFNIGFNYSMVYGSASEGAIVYASLPAMIAVAAVFALKERLSKLQTAGVGLSIAGVVIIVMNSEADAASPAPLLGAAWMMVAVISWTLYTIWAKRIANADQIVVVAVITLIGTLMLLPLAAVELMQVGWQWPSLNGWLATAFLGVIATGLAYMVYGWALRVLDATVVGVFMNLDPIVGVVTAVLLLGEQLHGGQVVGAIVAFAGMWLASTRSRHD